MNSSVFHLPVEDKRYQSLLADEDVGIFFHKGQYSGLLMLVESFYVESFGNIDELSEKVLHFCIKDVTGLNKERNVALG